MWYLWLLLGSVVGSVSMCLFYIFRFRRAQLGTLTRSRVDPEKEKYILDIDNASILHTLSKKRYIILKVKTDALETIDPANLSQK